MHLRRRQCRAAADRPSRVGTAFGCERIASLAFVMGTLSDQEVAAYHTLASGAVWWKSHDSVIAFRGDKAVEALNGLVTNDVAAMSSGECLYAAALSPKGKLVADMLVI